MHKLRIWLLFVMLSHAGVMYAQPNGPSSVPPLIDSLIRALPLQTKDTDKVKILNAISINYRTVNPEEGVKYGKQGLDLATRSDWHKGIAAACHVLGANYAAKADYQQALEYLFKGLKINEGLGDKQQVARLTGNIGSIYQSKDDYPKALEYFFKALKLCEEQSDKQGIAISTSAIGNVYLKLNNYSKALEYYHKALQLHK